MFCKNSKNALYIDNQSTISNFQFWKWTSVNLGRFPCRAVLGAQRPVLHVLGGHDGRSLSSHCWRMEPATGNWQARYHEVSDSGCESKMPRKGANFSTSCYSFDCPRHHHHYQSLFRHGHHGPRFSTGFLSLPRLPNLMIAHLYISMH